MSRPAPRVFTIPPGVPFLRTLAEALLSGRLVPEFAPGGDPLRAADATIYLPTRRAARALRSVLVDLSGDRSAAILPTIRALGEFDEDAADFTGVAELELPPPISGSERLMLLAPLVRLWKSRLPADVAANYGEQVVVPASTSDAIWLARDLAALMDEVETEGSDWSRLETLAPAELAGWWQVTLRFLDIVTRAWPDVLTARDRSNPAAYRAARILAEAGRLARQPPEGPVIAAGSTGSIPATAELLATIARLPHGAVVLPGFDGGMDADAWEALHQEPLAPPSFGHPQYGLAKLVGRLGLARDEVVELAQASLPLARRRAVLAEAMRPAETTHRWIDSRRTMSEPDLASALDGVTLIEAAIESDEALAIAIALRMAVEDPAHTAALVTGDRNLARRVAAELKRYGITADDSGGSSLAHTPAAELFVLMLEAVFHPGDPVPAVSLLKNPLLQLSMPRASARSAVETIELIALRGGTGRPDICEAAALFEERFARLAGERRQPFWLDRINASRMAEARRLLERLGEALAPLAALRASGMLPLKSLLETSIAAFEKLGRDENSSLAALYQGDAGERMADFLRDLLAADADLDVGVGEWPDVFAALIAPEVVKPRPGADQRVFIWGSLEARLQHVDTLVVGGLNEGIWPRRADTDLFLSRGMKLGLALEPPERRIGLAAHDFMMAFGAPQVILSRAARVGDAPSVASRWLQRLLAFAGPGAAEAMRARGRHMIELVRATDRIDRGKSFPRPNPKPPLAKRPKRFSVTEIETLRRDPYAIYARKVLGLHAVEPLLRDPGAADRGTMFHEILHRFTAFGVDPRVADAEARLLGVGRQVFDEAALPTDVDAVWWPRFVKLAPAIIEWERSRGGDATRHAEVSASATAVGRTGVQLSGKADRIDVRRNGVADILDYKTGSNPSKAQAHTLLAPQLSLEGALLARGAFGEMGKLTPADLAYVRLRAKGEVEEESILQLKGSLKSAGELSNEAWARLDALLQHYNGKDTGYLSRALPFKVNETGDYDHLARVLEWSAGPEADEFE
ncbi:MAG: double-strand break repair protein AddB [Rhizobiaceae bacterium]